MNRNVYGTWSIIFAGLALPITVLVVGVVSWYFKSTNPDNVNILASLAYLRPILLSSIATFVVVMLAAIVCALLGKRRDESPQLSNIGLFLVVVVSVLSLFGAIAHSNAGDAEEAYRIKTSQE